MDRMDVLDHKACGSLGLLEALDPMAFLGHEVFCSLVLQAEWGRKAQDP